MWSPTYRLYAAEFRCGVVKVGQTTQRGERRTSHLMFNGQPVIRCHYGPPHQHNWLPEQNLLNAVRRLGTVIQGREWFVGITFQQAKQLVDQVTRNTNLYQIQHQAEAQAFRALVQGAAAQSLSFPS